MQLHYYYHRNAADDPQPALNNDMWPIEIACADQFECMGNTLQGWAALLGRTVPTRLGRHTQLYYRRDWWLCRHDMERLAHHEAILEDRAGDVGAWSTRAHSAASTAAAAPPSHGMRLVASSETRVLRYPWSILEVFPQILRDCRASIPGRRVPLRRARDLLVVGRGSRILPGVVAEGPVVIGAHCTVGPNCYLRGPVVIGDRCRVGQAVEIKNSVVGAGSAVPHLSYVGDSVVGSGVNFGAGSITANVRHDRHEVRSQIHDRAGSTTIPSGRKKLGAIIGDKAQLGAATVILPGRKIGGGTSTYPHTVVARDIR